MARPASLDEIMELEEWGETEEKENESTVQTMEEQNDEREEMAAITTPEPEAESTETSSDRREESIDEITDDMLDEFNFDYEEPQNELVEDTEDYSVEDLEDEQLDEIEDLVDNNSADVVQEEPIVPDGDYMSAFDELEKNILDSFDKIVPPVTQAPPTPDVFAIMDNPVANTPLGQPQEKMVPPTGTNRGPVVNQAAKRAKEALKSYPGPKKKAHTYTLLEKIIHNPSIRTYKASSLPHDIPIISDCPSCGGFVCKVGDELRLLSLADTDVAVVNLSEREEELIRSDFKLKQAIPLSEKVRLLHREVELLSHNPTEAIKTLCQLNQYKDALDAVAGLNGLSRAEVVSFLKLSRLPEQVLKLVEFGVPQDVLVRIGAVEDKKTLDNILYSLVSYALSLTTPSNITSLCSAWEQHRQLSPDVVREILSA